MHHICDQCVQLIELVDLNHIDLQLIQSLIESNKVQLYAGNCYPAEFDKYLDLGNHYTVKSYLYCENCDEYYFIGFCLYGNPIIKRMDKGDLLNGILRLEWGYTGIYFMKPVSMDDVRHALINSSFIIAPVWSSLIDAYESTTAIRVSIHALKLLYNRIQKGEIIDLYYPAETKKQTLNYLTFDKIVRKYFSEFILNEIKSM